VGGKKFGAELPGKPRMPWKEALREIAGLLILEYGGFWQFFLWFWQFTGNKLRMKILAGHLCDQYSLTITSSYRVTIGPI